MTAPPPTKTSPVTAPDHARVRPATVLTLGWFGVLAVVLLWWNDTPSVRGFGDWLTNAGRITGLVAGYIILVLLVLMARVPALERGVGTDRLARWHAMAGRYTVCLAVAHTLLIIWGYAVTAHQNVYRQTGTLITSYPDVLMATVSVLLLVVIGSVSARAARRRLSYETWHFIHLYTYLAIALSFAHQFATGADFADDLRARVVWAGLYIAVASVLFWYRFARPVVQAFRHRMRVAAIRVERVDTITVWITGRALDRLGAEPGQFFRWRFLTRGMWWAANPYSLSAAPVGDLLRITVKHAGDHSAALAHLKVGTRVVAEGPFGAFTPARRRHRRVLLLAGGVGIAPIRALFESLPGAPGELTLLYRAHGPADVVFADELDWIARERGARVHYLFGPRGRGRDRDPLAAAELIRQVPALAEHDVYLCGPPGMTEHARSELRRAGVPRAQIHLESFAF
jgi:predicted ferric reductase